jgi:hypothetical protein
MRLPEFFKEPKLTFSVDATRWIFFTTDFVKNRLPLGPEYTVRAIPLTFRIFAKIFAIATEEIYIDASPAVNLRPLSRRNR